MPYTIKTKDGIKIENIPDNIDPNSPEVKARVEKIRGGIDGGGSQVASPAPSQPQTDQTPQATQPQQRSFTESLGGALTDIPAGVMNLIGTGNPDVLSRGVASAVGVANSPEFRRTAPVVAAAFIAPPSVLSTLGISATQSVVASSTILGATGWLGSLWAGDDVPEAAKNAIFASYPLAAKIGESTSLLKSMLKGAALDAPGMALYEVGSEGVSRSLRERKLTMPYESVNDAFAAVSIPMMIGAFTGSARGIGENASYMSKLKKQTKEELSAIGIDSMTLGMMDPEKWATAEQRIAHTDPVLAAKVNKFGDTATKRLQGIFGDVPHDTDVANSLNEYVGKYNKANADLDKLKKARSDAEYALSNADEMSLSPHERDEVLARVTGAKAAEINQSAFVSYYKGLADELAGGVTSADSSFSGFRVTVKDIFKVRKEQSAIAYKDTGVNLTDKFISTKELSKSASVAFSGRENIYTKAIIKKIDAAGEKLSVNDVRALRDDLASDFFGADPSQLDAAEALAGRAYAAIMLQTNKSITRVVGKDAAEKFASVNSWWAGTANASKSKYARQLLSDEPPKGIVDSIANDVKSGRFQNVNAFIKFVDAVGEKAPGVQQQGRAAIYSMVRNGFISNSTANGIVDYAKLTKSLNNADAFGFPVDTLGFGTRQQLKEVRSALDAFSENPGKVTTEQLDSMYSNPLFRSALQSGGSVRKVADAVAARSAFDDVVRADFLKEQAGVAQRASYGERFKRKAILDKTGYDVEQQAARIAVLKKDPLVMAFAKDSVGLPTKIAGGPGSILSTFKTMSPGEVNQVMRGMDLKRKDIADAVRRRITADTLGSLIKQDANSLLWGVDMNSFRAMFSPAIARDQTNIGGLLSAVLTPKELTKFKRFIPVFDRLARYQRSIGENRISQDLKTGLGTAFAVSLGRPGATAGASSMVGKFAEVVQNRKYSLLSKLVLDDHFAKDYLKYIQIGKGLEMAQKDPTMARFFIALRADGDANAEFEDSESQQR